MDQRDEPSGADIGPESVTAPPRSASPSADVARTSGLKAALRRARIENAERGDVVADLRDAEMTRLDILRDHLAPVFAEVPATCDMFDPGIAPGDHPRLFIDAVAFVEMARDRRSYRLLQDTRAGRLLLSESERLEATVRAVTDYIARRLVEREKALATPLSTPPPTQPSRHPATATAGAAPRSRPRGLRWLARGFLFIVEVIGSAVVFGAAAAGAIWLWQTYVK